MQNKLFAGKMSFIIIHRSCKFVTKKIKNFAVKEIIGEIQSGDVRQVDHLPVIR